MTTRASQARTKDQQQFTGRVRRWRKQWTALAPGGGEDGKAAPLAPARLSLLRWVATDEKTEERPGPRFPHLVPVQDPGARPRAPHVPHGERHSLDDLEDMPGASTFDTETLGVSGSLAVSVPPSEGGAEEVQSPRCTGLDPPGGTRIGSQTPEQAAALAVAEAEAAAAVAVAEAAAEAAAGAAAAVEAAAASGGPLAALSMSSAEAEPAAAAAAAEAAAAAAFAVHAAVVQAAVTAQDLAMEPADDAGGLLGDEALVAPEAMSLPAEGIAQPDSFHPVEHKDHAQAAAAPEPAGATEPSEAVAADTSQADAPEPLAKRARPASEEPESQDAARHQDPGSNPAADNS